MLWIVYTCSIALLYWVYDGYGRFLRLAVAIRDLLRRSSSRADAAEYTLPSLTVLLTVHNEEAVVRSRLDNVLACDYPVDSLRILVASDGSTDATGDIVRELMRDEPRVELFETDGLGKTATQNLAIQQISADLVVFTDADIRFDPMFLRHAALRFADPHVGAVDGRLHYDDGSQDALAQGQGYYWNYEHLVRQKESELGLLAVVAGACFAVRRELLQPMDPSIGEDCIVPLDVVSQSSRVIHEPRAVAWDSFDLGNGFAFRRRIRMTLRNWQGTWTRPRLLNPFLHPGYAFALWSHKLLRWLSPVFVVAAFVSSGVLAITATSVASVLAFLPMCGLFTLACVGWTSQQVGIRIPGAGAAFSFLLANLAFLVGVFRAVTGHRVRRYQKA